MDKKIANKWVKALRSGKFIQGEGALRVEYGDGKIGYCCLGVLASICGVEDKKLNGRDFIQDRFRERTTLGTHDGTPTKLNENGETELIKLRVKGSGNTVRTFTDLAEANDGGVSFETIATWIEKNHEKL